MAHGVYLRGYCRYDNTTLWPRLLNIGNGVTFLYISPQPALRSWTWLYRQKANETTFPTIYCPYGNILNFSRTSRIHFSANNTSFCPFRPMGLSVHRHTDTQKWKHSIRQFHSVHLADITRNLSSHIDAHPQTLLPSPLTFWVKGQCVPRSCHRVYVCQVWRW